MSTVTVTVDSKQFGDEYTLVVGGYWTKAGQLDWKIETSSSCIAAKLCAKGDTKQSS